jgi:hypothetical protein
MTTSDMPLDPASELASNAEAGSGDTSPEGSAGPSEAGESKPGATIRRVTASLRARDEANLQEVAELSGLGPNDAIRKALATEAWLQETLDSGGKVLVKGPDGIIREMQFVG